MKLDYYKFVMLKADLNLMFSFIPETRGKQCAATYQCPAPQKSTIHENIIGRFSKVYMK